MKNLLKTLALGSVFSLSLAVLADDHAAKAADHKAADHKADTAHTAATPAKKLDKKAAKEACVKEHKDIKGADLEKCITEKTHG